MIHTGYGKLTARLKGSVKSPGAVVKAFGRKKKK